MGRVFLVIGLLCASLFGSGRADARSDGIVDRVFPVSTGYASASAGSGAADDQTNPAPARVSVSRAADMVGQPVYFRQSSGLGSAGVVSISSRRLPAGTVFSVALRPVVTRPAMATSAALATLPGTMPASMPVAAYGITSGFGMRQHPILGVWRSHAGLDLAASYGSPIVATSDGMVSTAGWQGGYGLLVTLDHGGGLQTRYGHMSRLNVQPGQQVSKGSVIGYVGSSGLATGPHLHYEIRLNGLAINPATHIGGR